MQTTHPVVINDGAAAEAALAPLIDHLRGAAASGLDLAVAPGLLAEGTPVAELVAAPYTRLAAMVEESARLWSAPSHVAAALWWKRFSYWTTLPVTIGWAVDRTVPLMTAENTVYRRNAEEPLLVVGVNALRSASGAVGPVIRETLLEGLFAPVIEALHDLTRAGRRGLWGSVAESLTHPLDMVVSDPAAAAEELLRAVGGPVEDLMELPSLKRRTCCLWVTLPEADPCPTCCVLR
ncbi:hypothetical protein [Spirillospora sp. CA-294931]|uniref:hypothetical protein n=1 Tax=Spirillospora sp. CA-294931 TaxID=3240042 RepID=UPI003D9021E6